MPFPAVGVAFFGLALTSAYQLGRKELWRCSGCGTQIERRGFWSGFGWVLFLILLLLTVLGWLVAAMALVFSILVGR